jgi:hypothetical protein
MIPQFYRSDIDEATARALAEHRECHQRCSDGHRRSNLLSVRCASHRRRDAIAASVGNSEKRRLCGFNVSVTPESIVRLGEGDGTGG